MTGQYLCFPDNITSSAAGRNGSVEWYTTIRSAINYMERNLGTVTGTEEAAERASLKPSHVFMDLRLLR